MIFIAQGYRAPNSSRQGAKRGVNAQNAAFTYGKRFSVPRASITIAPACEPD
jgi:hypothetical protein